MVDDNLHAAAVLADLLKSMSFEVSVAHDGPQALARLTQAAAEGRPVEDMPPITRDRPAEQRAERIARGQRPAPGPRADTMAHQPAPAGLALGPGRPLPSAERYSASCRARNRCAEVAF